MLHRRAALFASQGHRATADSRPGQPFFCSDNNVQLPDEYDRIMKDLAPFRGLSASALVRSSACDGRQLVDAT